jgi:hypothetical protein
MVGSTSSFGAGNSDIYLVKVDSNIKYEWSAAIGHEFTEFGNAVKQTADGGYIICGHTNSIGNGSYDAYLVRTDSKGKLLWEKTFGGFDWDFAYDIETTADGGFLLVGETHSLGNGNADAYLIKTDKDGNLLWEKTMGGAGKDIAHALIATKDGNFAFCGENASKNPENKGDAWLVKFDGNGDTLWERDYGGIELDKALKINQLEDNSFLLTGATFEQSIDVSDNLILSINSSGIENWSKQYGGYEVGITQTDYCTDAFEYRTDKIIVVARTKSFGNGVGKYFNIILLQLDKATGNFIYGSTFGNPNMGEYCSECLYNSKDDFVSCVGVSKGFGNYFSNLSLLRTDTLSDYVEINSHRQDSLEKVPNAINAINANSHFIEVFIMDNNQIKIKGLDQSKIYLCNIHDVTGRVLDSFKIKDRLETSRDVQASNAILFVSVTFDESTITNKIFSK